jgi:hypothetical protein
MDFAHCDYAQDDTLRSAQNDGFFFAASRLRVRQKGGFETRPYIPRLRVSPTRCGPLRSPATYARFAFDAVNSF